MLNTGFNKFLEQKLNETKFSEKKLEKVVKLYSKIMGRKMKGEFYPLGLESFKRPMGSGKGYRVINDKGIQLRFNWDSKLAKESKFVLTSIDYWDSKNINFQKPTRTVTFAPTLNVIEVLDKVSTALMSGTIKESQEFLDDFLYEAREKREVKVWLKNKGLSSALTKDDKKLRDAVDAAGLTEELKVFMGEPETNSFEEDLEKGQKEFDNQVYANPETVFEDIEDLLSLVASKKWRTLIVCGMGGIGKTYHIVEGSRSLSSLLGPEGDKWTYHSGAKAAPFAFYKTLYQERDKIIVFDEADSLLKNKDIIMMLKPILDTSGSNKAEYMSGTFNMVGKSDAEIEEYCKNLDLEIADGKKIGVGKRDAILPSKFFFTGGMVFISNMKAKEIEQAIMSRSLFVDVNLAAQDVLKRIKSIAMIKAGIQGKSEKHVDETMAALGAAINGKETKVNYMTPEYARKNKQITVRAYLITEIMRDAGLKRWAELASLYA